MAIDEETGEDKWIVAAHKADELNDNVVIPGVGTVTFPRTIAHDRGAYLHVSAGRKYEIKPFYAPWPAYTVRPLGKEHEGRESEQASF